MTGHQALTATNIASSMFFSNLLLHQNVLTSAIIIWIWDWINLVGAFFYWAIGTLILFSLPEIAASGSVIAF